MENSCRHAQTMVSSIDDPSVSCLRYNEKRVDGGGEGRLPRSTWPLASRSRLRAEVSGAGCSQGTYDVRETHETC